MRLAASKSVKLRSRRLISSICIPDDYALHSLFFLFVSGADWISGVTYGCQPSGQNESMGYGNGCGVLEEVMMLVFLWNPLRALVVEVIVSEILEAFPSLPVFVFSFYTA